MKKVLVLDANQRSALAVTRSLGKHGVIVITADETPTSLAGSSRYSATNVSYPSPRQHSADFIHFLNQLIVSHKIDILFPITELTTSLVLENRDDLPEVVIPCASVDTVDSLADKYALMRLAESLTIPIPPTWYADNPRQLPVDVASLPYPLVLKPGKSWLPRPDGWARNAVRFAEDPDQADTILSTDPAFQLHPFLLQQLVPGCGQGVFALYDHGKPIAFFAHRRVREKPPSGGVSVLSESVTVDAKLLHYSRLLLDAVSWHGVAMVEFKVDEATATPYLMEVNTRFWGSLQLAVNAGVDFPWLLYRMAAGETVTPVSDYRIGVRSRWLLGDLDSLYLQLRDRRCSFNQKLSAILSFLRPSPLRTRHEINRWDDPGPFWFELKQYLRALTG